MAAMLAKLVALLRGLIGAPWLVGLARGILEAALMGALVAIAAYINAHAPAALVPYVPVALLIIRALEGAVDQIDPAKQRGPNDAQPPAAGG